MNLPLTAQRRSPARKVLFEKVKGETSQLDYGLYLADSALAVFRKELRHISENSKSTQGLYRIEILTANKKNCLFLKVNGKNKKKQHTKPAHIPHA